MIVDESDAQIVDMFGGRITPERAKQLFVEVSALFEAAQTIEEARAADVMIVLSERDYTPLEYVAAGTMLEMLRASLEAER